MEVKEPTLLEQVFGRPRVCLPVIHPVSCFTSMESIAVAVAANADGVFLINQGMNLPDIQELLREIRRVYPKLWIGLNILGMSGSQMMSYIYDTGVRLQGLWADDHEDFRGFRSGHGEAIQLTFGGTAFKYQRQVKDEALAGEARTALTFCNVPTTSGPATGEPPVVDKLKRLREGLGDAPLAVASGVSPLNVRPMLPYAQAFLVATGIEQRFGVLHAQMDRAVLDAYGWQDIRPEYDFREQLDESIRLTWSEETRDEVLARLLELNRVMAEAEADALRSEPEEVERCA